MEGIGVAHFPITTKNPEVQMWFDQGIALLHSFWDYEAERSFRWCLNWSPTTRWPYWGLARASIWRPRQRTGPAELIREAVKRKDNATAREQLYIDALDAEMLPDSAAATKRRRRRSPERRRGVISKMLETLCVKYPDDMEARALLALATMGEIALRHRTDDPRGPREAARPPRRAPLPHSQLGLSRARAGARERRAIRRDRARHRPCAAHARPHLQHRRDVE